MHVAANTLFVNPSRRVCPMASLFRTAISYWISLNANVVAKSMGVNELRLGIKEKET